MFSWAMQENIGLKIDNINKALHVVNCLSRRMKIKFAHMGFLATQNRWHLICNRTNEYNVAKTRIENIQTKRLIIINWIIEVLLCIMLSGGSFSVRLSGQCANRNSMFWYFVIYDVTYIISLLKKTMRIKKIKFANSQKVESFCST